jgi:hypothetical protein
MTVGRRAAAALAPMTVAVVLVTAGCGNGESSSSGRAPTTTVPARAPALTREPQRATRPWLGTYAMHIRRRAQLRAHPGGRVLGVIRTRTRFASPVYLVVAARRPGWVRVRTSVPHHPVGWIPASAGRIYRQSRSIVIDLSRHALTVYRDGQVDGRYRVAIGAPGTTTPHGHFGVTDRLRVPPGTDYGCCIMALTAHQPHLAQGWGGGDRIAIHATAETWAIGKAVSHGCIRATSATMHRLMRRIRLGASVTVHA